MQKTAPTGGEITAESHKLSPRHLTAIVESLEEAIIGQTLDGLITSWNGGAKHLFRYSEEEILGQHISKVIPPDLIGGATAECRHALQSERLHGIETVGIARDGRQLDILLSIVPLSDQTGLVTEAVTLVRDITQRKEMERRLTYQTSLLQNIFDAVIATDHDFRIQSWNQGAETLFGWREEEALGQIASDLLQTDFLHVTREQVRDEFNRHGFWRGDIVQRCKDGHLVDISTLVSLVRNEAGKAIGRVAVHRDITATKRLEQEILEISQREQRRIGQDLHDGLGSHLSGLAMLSRGLADDLRKGNSIRTKDMEELADLLRQGVEQARELARGLNPLWNRAYGLVHALHDIAGRTERLYRIPCSLQLHATIPDLHEEIGTRLYWIVQEGINNAVKHAHAEWIRIDAEYSDGLLVLTVTDNGIGIPAGANSGEGMGLRIMQYRAATIGARLTIRPGQGEGTVVSCSIGLAEAARTPARDLKEVT